MLTVCNALSTTPRVYSHFNLCLTCIHGYTRPGILGIIHLNPEVRESPVGAFCWAAASDCFEILFVLKIVDHKIMRFVFLLFKQIRRRLTHVRYN